MGMENDNEKIYEWYKFKAVIEFIMMIFARTAEVFLRYNFGERYFDLVGSGSSIMVLGFLVLGLFFIGDKEQRSQLLNHYPLENRPAVAREMPGVYSGEGELVFVQAEYQTYSRRSPFYENGQFLGFFLLAVALMCYIHLVQSYNRRRKGILLHSRYSGTPWLAEFLPFKLYVIKRWCEPGLVFVVGFVLTPVMPVLSMWLFITGACMTTRAWMEARAFRTRILDAMDKQIEAEDFEEAIKGEKQGKKGRGYEVWTVFSSNEQSILLRSRQATGISQPRERESSKEILTQPNEPAVVVKPEPPTVGNMVRNLDPKLQAMMEGKAKEVVQLECPQCKKSLRPDARFCDRCGTRT